MLKEENFMQEEKEAEEKVCNINISLGLLKIDKYMYRNVV